MIIHLFVDCASLPFTTLLIHATHLFFKKRIKISANSNKICTDGFFNVLANGADTTYISWQVAFVLFIFISILLLFEFYRLKMGLPLQMNQQAVLFSKIWVKWIKITPALSWNWIFCLASSFSLAIQWFFLLLLSLDPLFDRSWHFWDFEKFNPYSDMKVKIWWSSGKVKDKLNMYLCESNFLIEN